MPFYKWRFRALRDLSWPKNFKIKSGVNTNNTNNENNMEEMQLNNQKLKTQIDGISLENKKLNKKIKQLRNKNLELKKVLYIVKKERDDYSKSINQSLKLLKNLKENGIDLSNIIENLSSSDSEEDEEEETDEIYYNNNILKLKEKEKDKYLNKEKEESDSSNLSFGTLECHEEFSIKKIPKELKIIPKLKIYDINKKIS